MNEYQRQAYLSSLGVENYMPRWRLPIAPEPVACVLPILNASVTQAEGISLRARYDQHQFTPQDNSVQIPKVNPVAVADVLRDLVEPKKSIPLPDPVVHPFESKAAEVILPFALSIWRPQAGLLIIDSRNTQLALPTELLLRNILSAVFSVPMLPGREEVLRWPLVENVVVSSTEEDARNALQVWLEVELDQRPATHVLLFGKNAARYFLPEEIPYDHNLWQWLGLPPLMVQAMLAPGLVELLQQPLLKRKLWQCLMPLRTSI